MKRSRSNMGLMVLAACLTVIVGAPAWAQNSQVDPRGAGLDPGRLAPLRGELQRFVADNQIAGAVTVVARQGKVGSLEAVGYRDREAKAPMRADTIFRIASMTKIVTAVALLMLEDQGKLTIDDPVEKHLPEFRGLKLIEKQNGNTFTLGAPPRAITIKDLLTHTSGMRCQPPAGFADLGKKKNRSLAEAVVAFSQQPLESAPGKVWRYCGTAFGTVGRVIEVASGMSFEAFLQQRLFRPLGMKDTTFRLTPAQGRRLAAAYKRQESAAAAPAAAGPTPAAGSTAAPASAAAPAPSPPAAPAPPPTGPIVRSEDQGPAPGQPVTFTDPSGGLYSTAGDYTRLMQMLLDEGTARGRRFLRPETVVKMTGVHFTSPEKVGFSPGLGMGLGVQVVMTPTGISQALSAGSFGHGGAHGTQAWADPARKAIYILMIQRQGYGNGDMSDVRAVFQRLAAAAMVEPASQRGAGASRRGRVPTPSGRRP